MAFCPAPPDKGMVGGVIETVDCHIRVLVQDSYRELVGPNTWFATAFTGLLTIYIALLGYQLLFGRGGLRVTELPIVGLKIGLILAFLTSWAAYQTLIFDLLFDGPAQIMKAMMAVIPAFTVCNLTYCSTALRTLEITRRADSLRASLA